MEQGWLRNVVFKRCEMLRGFCRRKTTLIVNIFKKGKLTEIVHCRFIFAPLFALFVGRICLLFLQKNPFRLSKSLRHLCKLLPFFFCICCPLWGYTNECHHTEVVVACNTGWLGTKAWKAPNIVFFGFLSVVVLRYLNLTKFKWKALLRWHSCRVPPTSRWVPPAYVDSPFKVLILRVVTGQVSPCSSCKPVEFLPVSKVSRISFLHGQEYWGGAWMRRR